MLTSLRPVHVAIVDELPLVVAGVTTLLRPARNRIRVEEYSHALPPRGRADVVLVDPFGQTDTDSDTDAETHSAVDRLRAIRLCTGARVLVYSWDPSQRQVEQAISAGASGYLPKRAGGDQMIDAVMAAAAGRTVRAASRADDEQTGTWPGQAEGLTARESEIVAMIVAGLSNQQIAGAAYLSINSIKSHVRNAYRKMGVANRSQALLWGIHHGFQPGPSPAQVSEPASS